MILNRIIGSSRNHLCNLRPFVAHSQMRVVDYFVLFFRPSCFLDRWIEMIMPPTRKEDGEKSDMDLLEKRRGGGQGTLAVFRVAYKRSQQQKITIDNPPLSALLSNPPWQMLRDRRPSLWSKSVH